MFAGAYSESTLEHLVAPWVVAVEINRVLMVGGYVLHVVPMTWPEHAQPNDFWRFTVPAVSSREIAQKSGELVGESRVAFRFVVFLGQFSQGGDKCLGDEHAAVWAEMAGGVWQRRVGGHGRRKRRAQRVGGQPHRARGIERLRDDRRKTRHRESTVD